jgi:hypothetical protein
MSAALSARAYVHSVARHRHDFAICLQRAHKAKLLLRAYTREDARLSSALCQRCIIKPIELRSGDHQVGWMQVDFAERSSGR